MHKPHLQYKNQTPKERSWTIHIIAAVKFLKGLLLLIVAIKLLTLWNRDVADWAADFVTRHGMDVDNKYIHPILEKLENVHNKELAMMSAGSFLYSGLQITEGVGLWLEKRWAEILTVIATSLLIPVELYEMYEKFTFVRLAILFINILIVLYLLSRLKYEKKVKRVEEAQKTENPEAL